MLNFQKGKKLLYYDVLKTGEHVTSNPVLVPGENTRWQGVPRQTPNDSQRNHFEKSPLSFVRAQDPSVLTLVACVYVECGGQTRPYGLPHLGED